MELWVETLWADSRGIVSDEGKFVTIDLRIMGRIGGMARKKAAGWMEDLPIYSWEDEEVLPFMWDKWSEFVGTTKSALCLAGNAASLWNEF